MEEARQWRLFLAGDEKALAFFFRRYYNDLLNYGLKLSGNKDIADDSIQDLFLKLWRSRSHLSATDKVKPYLLKALRRHIQVNMDISYRFKRSLPTGYFSMEYSVEDLLIHEEVTSEMHRKVLAVLNRLSVRQREAIYLRFFEGLEFDAIAQIMEMNEQSVHNLVFRGMKAMRELLLSLIIALLIKSLFFF